MISGCYGAPVRTKHADLNKSEIKIPAQPAKEHHDLSATIVSYQTTVLEMKGILILAMFPRQSSARDWETISSPRGAPTPRAVERLTKKTCTEIKTAKPAFHPWLKLHFALSLPLPVHHSSAVSYSHTLQWDKQWKNDMWGPAEPWNNIYSCQLAAQKPWNKSNITCTRTAFDTQHDHQRRDICSQPWLQTDFQLPILLWMDEHALC